MRFRDVQCQERALSILRRALASGRTHHGYLFEGPEGVGKELAARALAARLLCEDDRLAADADACGQCTSCRLLATDNHPDFHLIHRGLHRYHPDRAIRSSKGLFLAVPLIRQFLIEPAALKPLHGRRRVFLLRDAERMNEEAQNALLKTLEEPPGAACLILLTTSPARLLPTVRSRCQMVPFSRLPPAFVAEQLVARRGLMRADARALALLADGRLGVALRWHEMGVLGALEAVGAALDALSAPETARGVPPVDPEAFAKSLLEIATTLATQTEAAEEAEPTEEVEAGEPAEAKSARGLPTDVLRDLLKLVLLLVAAFYRDALVDRAGAHSLCCLPGQAERISRLAARSPRDRLHASIEAVCLTERMLDRNVAPQLACERLAVALSGELPT